MTEFSVVPVDHVDIAYAPWQWPFASEHRHEIDAHFAQLQRTTPELWNGRILMLRNYTIAGRVFQGWSFEASFADLLAWRDWGFPDKTVNNFFAMGALRGSDGGFILGEMGGHTANAGKIYFPAGTPDPDDVRGDTVDLSGSLVREVAEEIGLTPADFTAEPGWFTVLGSRIAHMKLLQAAVSAAELRERILGLLVRQPQPELTSVHIVRGPADLTPAMPAFMAAFLTHIWTRA
jgi:8-oxo-dGTP pyrophosphatase MutT (NUDIX family)